MKPTNTVAKLFSSVSTLAFVAGAVAFNGLALGQVGQVVAWGAGTTNTGNYSEFGQSIVPDSAQSGVTAIAGGYFHTIALKNSAVLAWGWNGFGQCTIPDSAQSGVTAIAGGHGHTIALKNGGVLAWGAGTTNTESPPNYGQSIVPASANSGVTAIAAGMYHCIALKDGTVLAWGRNDEGQCSVPIAAQSGVSAIASGWGHAIALKDGRVLAWGLNNTSQCAVPASAQSGVTAIAGGELHTIALKSGAVLAWGSNGNGQCSIPDSAQSGVTAIAAGMYHCIALKDGTVLAWGNNGSGQCIIPADAQSGVTAITGGYSNIIALKGPIATITGVLPISGPSSGDTNITITGTNFEEPVTVAIGGTPATNVVVVSDTKITATTPAGFPGPAVVKVNLGSSTAFYYRPACGSDLDNSGMVDSSDLSIVLLDFGSCSESAVVAPQQEPLILQTAEPAKSVPNKK